MEKQNGVQVQNIDLQGKKTVLRRLALGGIVVAGAVTRSLATGEFDATASIGILTAGIATVAVMVGGIVAISGGMDVYGKVRSFFKRAK